MAHHGGGGGGAEGSWKARRATLLRLVKDVFGHDGFRGRQEASAADSSQRFVFLLVLLLGLLFLFFTFLFSLFFLLSTLLFSFSFFLVLLLSVFYRFSVLLFLGLVLIRVPFPVIVFFFISFCSSIERAHTSLRSDIFRGRSRIHENKNPDTPRFYCSTPRQEEEGGGGGVT